MRYLFILLCIVMAASASAQVQYLGSPTTTVRNRGNFVSDSLFYLPKRQKAPTDTGAVRYAIADSSVYVWTGYQWNKIAPGAYVAISDTATMLNPYTRGAGTTNYLVKWSGSRSLGVSSILDSSTNATFVIRQNGNIGIGVTPSQWSGFNNVIQMNNGAHIIAANNSFIQLGANSYYDGSDYRRVVTGFSSRLLQNDGQFFFMNASNAAAGTTISYSERMRITADGELLIGTTSDAGAYALQVAGSIYNTTGAVFAASSGSVGIGTTSTGSYKLKIGGTSVFPLGLTSSGDETIMQLENTSTNGRNWYMISGGASGGFTDGSFGFYDATAAAIRLLITKTGTIGIGTSSPSNRLSVFSLVSNSSIANFSGTETSRGLKISTIAAPNNDDGVLFDAQSTNGVIAFATASTEKLRINNSGELLIGSSADAGAYALQVTGAIYNTTTLTTGAPTSGTAKPWRLGEADTVSPTSPNRTIRVEIDGTVYYLHAKTTND